MNCSETKHTPGPWHVQIGPRKNSIPHIRSENMDYVMDSPSRGSMGHGSVRQMADAHLIAAAPELLAALELIVSDDKFTGDNYGERRDAWIETARAIIARAKGAK